MIASDDGGSQMSFETDPLTDHESPRSSDTRRSDRSRPDETEAAARVVRGIADGFTEASQAFSNEIEGASGYADLTERLIGGVIRANGRFLDELAGVLRRATDEVADSTSDLCVLRRSAVRTDDIDYERLADLVA